MKIALTIAAMLISIVAYAHSGGTDRLGCHTDHKTGLWHCH